MLGLLGDPAAAQQSEAYQRIVDVDNPPIQTFIVPQGISELLITAQGAHGSNPGKGASGGFGSLMQAQFAVGPDGPLKPGQQLDVWVGCYGDTPVGYGWGGDKGVADPALAGDGGYGGGGSAVLDHATQAPLLVAGGGGGGGSKSGVSSGGSGGDSASVPQAGEGGGGPTGGEGGCINCQDPGEIDGLDGGDSSRASAGGGGGAGTSYFDRAADFGDQATSQLAQDGTVAFSWGGASLDADGDGIPDALDRCRGSDLSERVVLGRCDSGAGNDLDVDGCTITDRVAAITAGASNRGQFVGRVVQLWHELHDREFLTRAEAKAIYRCAIQVGLARLVR
jgi:hypothetical protein